MPTTITITAKGGDNDGPLLNQIVCLLQRTGLAPNYTIEPAVHHALLAEGMEAVTFEADPSDDAYILTDILIETAHERGYQINKWGNETDDTKNTPWMWVSYIASYATGWMRGEFSITKSCADRFRTAMIKTAATAIAAVESLDRQRLKNGGAFYEEPDPEPSYQVWRAPEPIVGWRDGASPFPPNYFDNVCNFSGKPTRVDP